MPITEDCVATKMSAWFVLAASGLHQSCPGDPRFEIFTPLIDKVTITLDSQYTKGGTFTITAKNNSPENVYIQSASLNGRPLIRKRHAKSLLDRATTAADS